MNKSILSGNITKEPEISKTPSGTSVAKFTLAVQRKYQNADGEKETDFINCVAWRNLADTIGKYVHKGDKIGVIGAIQVRSYEAQDGSKRYVTEVVADEVDFINTKKEVAEKVENKPEFAPVDDDDLPF